MDEFQPNTPAPSQSASVLPESLIRSIVKDDLARQRLAEENEALKARIAELEAAAAAPGTADTDPAPGPAQKSAPAPASAKPASPSGAKANLGPKTVGAMKWL